MRQLEWTDLFASSLRWRHNGRDSVSNHQPHHCLLNRLFGCRSKKTWKLRVTGLCVGISPGTGEFLAQMASNSENVSIWWRHHVICQWPNRSKSVKFRTPLLNWHEGVSSMLSGYIECITCLSFLSRETYLCNFRALWTCTKMYTPCRNWVECSLYNHHWDTQLQWINTIWHIEA